MSSNVNFVQRSASSQSKIPEHDQRRRITISSSEWAGTAQSMSSRQTSISYGTLQSQWEILMRKFSQDCKGTDHCCPMRSSGEPMTCESRPLKKFSTGSTYEGTWDALGMCGFGIYTFPNGIVYRGEFEDNMFHGDGEMRYPDGMRVRGRWHYGDLIERTIIFNDEVHYREDSWKYCKDPDRRFSMEIKDGIHAGGHSYMTNEKTPAPLPDGTYDTGDGVYDPKTDSVCDYEDNTRIVRCPAGNMKSWIQENCRKAPDTSVGPRPDLYDSWLTPTLLATIPDPPEWMSNDDSEPKDIYTDENYYQNSSTMMRFRSDSYAKRSKLKFDPNYPHVDHPEHTDNTHLTDNLSILQGHAELHSIDF